MRGSVKEAETSQLSQINFMPCNVPSAYLHVAMRRDLFSPLIRQMFLWNALSLCVELRKRSQMAQKNIFNDPFL